MRALACLVLIALSGCSSEPDFDERFEETQADIEARAKALDQELKKAPDPDGEAEEANP